MATELAVRELTAALAAPFDEKEIKWKPQMVKANKCLAIAYVDVRVIEDRLDGVLGVENWQDSYDVLPDGSVVCRLAVRFGGEWVTKTDVGSMSEQPDGGDRLKAAFSDAMKRAAIKYGIGRYIYRLPSQWVDFDPAKKQIVTRPRLPDWANPGAAKKPAPPPVTVKQLPAAPVTVEPATDERKAAYDKATADLKAAAAKSCDDLHAVWVKVFKAGKAVFGENLFAALETLKDELKAKCQQAAGKPGGWARKFEQDAATALSMADVDELSEHLKQEAEALTDDEYKRCITALNAAYGRVNAAAGK